MRYSMYLYSFKIRRMDTFFRTTVCALAAALLLLAACDKKPGRDAVPAVAPSQADQEIALEIYALIPQTDLPDYCRDLSQDKDETAGDPRNFTAQVQGYDLGLEAGFNGLFTLHCYPLSAGGWRAFWIASAGMEGLLGFDRAGAYNYVDGKLVSLPKERFDELVGQVLWANEGAYLELEEDAVTVAEVNALGNQEILARFPWNGRNFGDL